MVKNIFKLDLRSLALVRILLGILAFFDTMRRIGDLDAFYVDSGIISRSDLINEFGNYWKMTLLNLNGSYEFALILALLGMTAAITFALGWRTRLSNLILWLVTFSFQARFPEANTSGGDYIIRILYFYCLFLPMGAAYSVDHAVSGKKYESNEYLSVFSAMWVMQIFLIYFFTFLYKWAPVYHTTYEAVWYMLQLDFYTTSVGKWLGQQYQLTRVLSFASYALEIVGPIIILIPWKRDLFRSAAVVSFWLFHLGIGLTMHLGNFVPICLIMWAAMIPTTWWDYLERKWIDSTEPLLTLYYDVDSKFARQLSQILKEMLFLHVNVEPSSVLEAGHFDENKRLAIREDKFSLITGFAVLPKLLSTSHFSIVRKLGLILGSDLSIYLNEVQEVGSVQPASNHRPSNKIFNALQAIAETLGFGTVKYKLNRLEKALGALVLVLIIGWNIDGYVDEDTQYMAFPLRKIMYTLQLNQGWAMFAPHPQLSDGWWVMDGKLKNGSSWDALNNKEVNFDRPDYFWETYSSDDWRKFMDNLQGSRDEKYLLALGKFLCRRWNSEHGGGEQLETFNLYFMQEWTNPPNEPAPKVKKLDIWTHSCF